MSYFKSMPRGLEEAARIDGAMMRVGCARPEEFLYTLIFLTTSEVRTVPIGAIAELIRGDVLLLGPADGDRAAGISAGLPASSVKN